MELSGSVWRWRRPKVDNPYNPDRTEWGRWADAAVVELEGAAVLSSSSWALRAEGREQALTAKSLFLNDPGADVQRGDGISLRAGGSAPDFEVRAVPSADTNPFTDWQPLLEVPLIGASG